MHKTLKAPPDKESEVLVTTKSQNKKPQPHQLLPDAIEIENKVAQPYKIQEQLLQEQDAPFNQSLVNVKLLFPLNKVKDFAPRLFKLLSQLEENSQVLHSTLKDFDAPNSTYLQVEILGIPTMAVIDTGAPLVILSSSFASKIRFQPDLEYNKFFGTAGQSKVQALGAYLSIPISFGNILTTSPAIFLYASGYNVLLGTSYLEKYSTVIDNRNNTFNLLGHLFPLLRQNSSLKGSDKKNKVLHLHGTNLTFGIQSKFKGTSLYLPSKWDMKEPLPIWSQDSLTIHPGEQVSVTTGTRIILQEGIHGIISPIRHPRKGRPLVASGILLANSVDLISVLLANPYNEPIQIRKREIIALFQAQRNEDVSEIYVAGGVEDLRVLLEEEFVCHVVPEEQIGDINAQEKQVFSNCWMNFRISLPKTNLILEKLRGPFIR